MSESPTVSVIIPAYNAAATIEQAVGSALEQTYTDLEIIVIDDGSTDDTRAVLAPYMERIRYVWQANAERSAARNHGIRLARGEYIAFLDADDVWLPEKLALQVAALERYPEAVLAYSLADNINIEGESVRHGGSTAIELPQAGISPEDHSQWLLFGNTVTAGGSTAIVRRRALDKTQPFDQAMSLAEDMDMWLRLSWLGPFVRVPAFLAHRRVYGWEKELRAIADEFGVTQRIHMLDKAVRTRPDKAPAALIDRAKAEVFVQSATANFHLGHGRAGRRRLSEALCLDPSRGSQEAITAMLEAHARRIWRQYEAEGPARDFLETAVANLPEGCAMPHRGAAGILARLYMADAFRAYEQADAAATRTLLRQGLRLDPGWLRNRGVLAMAGRALLSVL